MQPTSELDYYKIGQRVKEARKEKHITQDTLSQQCGCTISYLSRFENGKIGISLDKLYKISVELDKSMDYFFVDNPGAKPQTVIDQFLAEKLKDCDSQTLVMLGRLADELKEYRTEILESQENQKDKNG